MLMNLHSSGGHKHYSQLMLHVCCMCKQMMLDLEVFRLPSAPCKICSLKSFYRSTTALLPTILQQITGHGWAD